MTGYEPEELTDAQVVELVADLEALHDELTEALDTGESATKTVELDQSAVGRLTRMDAMQSQEMAKANARAHTLRLAQVAQALRLAGEDEYGYCRRCAEPVGYRRLKARPETPFCLVCQGAAEKR